MSAFRAGLSLCSRRVTASSGRVVSRQTSGATSAKRCYSDLPFYAYTSTVGLGGVPLYVSERLPSLYKPHSVAFTVPPTVFNTQNGESSETNVSSTYRAFGGAASVMGAGFYALGKDPRDIKHNDHQAQLALNPKRSFRDSKSTRWTTI